MPRIQKQKIAIGYQVRPIKKTSTPRDIGDPARARVDTLKWLKGEGPVPEQFNILLQDDEEALDHYRKDLWVHPERAATPGRGVHQFIAEAGAAEKDLLKSEQNRRQRATREQTQKAANDGVKVRLEGRDKWEGYARKCNRGEDETLNEMAIRIQRKLLDLGWAPFRISEHELQSLCDECAMERQDVRLWRDIPKVDRKKDMWYFPSHNIIVRFLANPDKRERKRKSL